MRLFVPLLLAATVAVVPSKRATFSRAHPDFTGSWTLDPAKSEGPMVPTSASLKVTQDEKSVKVERTTTAMGMTRSATATYALDGSPSKNTVSANGQNIDFNSTAEWSDNVLVIKTTADFGGGSFSGTERYSLSDDKKTLTIASDATIAGQTATGKQTFIKQ